MNKLIGFSVGAATLLAFAAPTFAASVTSQAIFDGQTQVYGNAGTSVQATFQIDIPAGQVLHAIRTKTDSQPTVCTAVGPFEGAQVVDVTTNITLPPNTNNGGYSLVADLYYTDTLPQAEAMTGDLACTSSVGGAHVNTSAYNGGTVVNVLPSGGDTGNTGSTSNLDALTALVANLAAQIQLILHPATSTGTGTPTPVSTACTAFTAAMQGTVQGQSQKWDGAPNVKLQGFLLSQGESIPALAAGASFGFYGVQTSAAVAAFNASNHCN